MATITQIRGALLEEAVLFLLNKIGYDTIDLNGAPRRDSEQMRSGHSGLEVRGRGTWHQIDAFAIWRHSPAFMYPLKLIVEAKCYNARRPVGVEVPRNVIGVLKDISENYFTLRRRQGRFHAPRYNYAAAIFSTSGFTGGAIEYAMAHQVFLIQYENVPAIQPLIDAIKSFDEDCLVTTGREAISAARGVLRAWLNDLELDQGHEYALTQRGLQLLRGSVARACRNIRGSYFGMLQGRWPLHLLMDEPLPPAAFEDDSISCKLLGEENGSTQRGISITPMPSVTSRPILTTFTTAVGSIRQQTACRRCGTKLRLFNNTLCRCPGLLDHYNCDPHKVAKCWKDFSVSLAVSSHCELAEPLSHKGFGH